MIWVISAPTKIEADISRGAGYVDWKELLEDIANSLDLDINRELDPLSIAQCHVNAIKEIGTKNVTDEFL